MTQPLSPAAQAVIDAWVTARRNQTRTVGRYEALAAALVAVANQVTPEAVEPEYTPNGGPNLDVACVGVWLIWHANSSVRTKLLAIAAELKGQSPTQPINQEVSNGNS